MAYHFQIAYVPENIQSIKKYQRGGHKRLSGSVHKNELSLQQGVIRGEGGVLETGAGRWQVTSLVMGDTMYRKAHFPVERKKDKNPTS